MLYPLFKVAIKRPALIVDHLHNYLDLFRQETRGVAANAMRKLVALAVGIICLILFLVFAGVAAMLGLMLNQFQWALVIVPAVPLLMALIAFAQSSKPVVGNEITDIKQQFMADLDVLQAAGDKNAR